MGIYINIEEQKTLLKTAEFGISFLIGNDESL